jgi:S-formylglutathione hydrolase FrmB
MCVDNHFPIPFPDSFLKGTGDNFYKQGQLLPENFLKAARDAGHDEVQVRVRSQDEYDHSYYFVGDLMLFIDFLKPVI